MLDRHNNREHKAEDRKRNRYPPLYARLVVERIPDNANRNNRCSKHFKYQPTDRRVHGREDCWRPECSLFAEERCFAKRRIYGW
jgi:hypothetical protein